MAEEVDANTSTPLLPEKLSNPSSNPSQTDQQQLPQFYGFSAPNGQLPMFPVFYPALVQGEEQMDHGPGIYAVPTLPFMGPVAGFPSNTLIPFTYNVPTGPGPNETGTGGEGQQQAGEQRQVVVRRFQIALHLDLLLILKLAAVIVLFNQDGSRQRLVLLIFFAILVYLYQTGALSPLTRWLQQGMQRAGAPPQQPRPAVRADNNPGNENAPLLDGHVGLENENRPDGDGNQPENEAVNENNRWWGLMKEIQLIVFGFITSLLPGFHNID